MRVNVGNNAFCSQILTFCQILIGSIFKVHGQKQIRKRQIFPTSDGSCLCSVYYSEKLQLDADESEYLSVEQQTCEGCSCLSSPGLLEAPISRLIAAATVNQAHVAEVPGPAETSVLLIRPGLPPQPASRLDVCKNMLQRRWRANIEVKEKVTST